MSDEIKDWETAASLAETGIMLGLPAAECTGVGPFPARTEDQASVFIALSLDSARF